MILSPTHSMAAAPVPDSPGDARLKKACKEFEGQFFALMLHEMRKTVPADPLLKDDAGQNDIFQTMSDDNMAQEMARKAGSNDLAALLFNQLGHTAAPIASPKPVAPPAGLPLSNFRLPADNGHHDG